MVNSTTNTYKNYYGKKRRKKPVNKRLRKQIVQVLEEKEKSEVERKYIDIDGTTPTSVSSSGIIHHLSPCTPGTGYDERVGQNIKGKSLLMRFNLIHADSTNIIRVIIFRWFCETTPTVSSIIQTPGAGIPWPLNPTTRDNSGVIQVLYDNLFASSTNTNANIVDKLFIERNMNIDFQDDDTVGLGHVYLCAISDSVAASHPTIEYWSRMRFTDC